MNRQWVEDDLIQWIAYDEPPGDLMIARVWALYAKRCDAEGVRGAIFGVSPHWDSLEWLVYAVGKRR